MRGFFGVVVAWSVLATASAGDQDAHIAKTFKTNNGYGIASVAGITSRNGRVSSVSGVNFFPSGSNPFSFPMDAQGRSIDIPEPISFSKEENGKFTAGQIKYGPGSVSVTSVARSGFPEDSTKTKSAMPNLFAANQFKNAGLQAMVFHDPFSSFNARSLNPWFPGTFMFRQQSLPSFNSVRPGWAYSNINPLYNFWQR